MSDTLPDYQISEGQLEEYRDFYRALLGYVPPRIMARTDLLARIDPETLQMQEDMRRRLMYPTCFDTKTSQLMLFGMLLMNLQDATKIHGTAARRAGATWEEMNAVVGLAYLFRGLSAANLGAQIIAEIAAAEPEGGGQE